MRTPEQTGSYIVTLTRVKDDLAALLQVAMRNPQLVADQLELLRHCPRHAAEVGRVLRLGGERHGVVGSAPIWTVDDHLSHAMDHLRNAMAFVGSRDRDTGALDLTHAAARCHLGGELELVRR